MILLGKVIKLAIAAQSQFPEDVAQRDPELATQLAAQADCAGMDVPEFVADTLVRFMSNDDGESWTTVLSNIQRSDDPGFAFVSTIVRTRLEHRC